MLSDLERHFEKAQKLLALAGSTVNEHETALAVRLALKHLDAHPLPLRWFVRRGTTVRVVPLAAMTSAREATASIQNIQLRKDNWFFEQHRVKDAVDAAVALGSGFVFFQRHGYACFVPVKHTEIYL